MNEPKMKDKTNRTLFVVLFTVFLDVVGFGILIPIIPQLLTDLTSKYYISPPGMSIAEKTSNGFIILGFLTAVYPIAQFFATPILGQLSDKYGRKLILGISLVGTSISYVIFAIGIMLGNIPLLFASRIFDGITGGNISVARAALADISTPQNRAKTFGLFGAAFGIGFVLGPNLGSKLSDSSIVSWFNPTTPFWFAAILAAINVVSLIFIFEETLKTLGKDIHIKWSQSIRNITKAYFLVDLRSLFMTNFLFQAGFTFFQTFFTVFALQKIHIANTNIGDLFSYFGIWIAVGQIAILPRLLKRYREDQILKVSIISGSLLIGSIFLCTQWWQLLLIMPFLAVTIGCNFANLPALISRVGNKTNQGEILGISSSIESLAQTAPPIISGYLAATISPEIPMLISSLTLFVAGCVFCITFKRRTTQEVKEDARDIAPFI